jgi:hypothetical protein
VGKTGAAIPGVGDFNGDGKPDLAVAYDNLALGGANPSVGYLISNDLIRSHSGMGNVVDLTSNSSEYNFKLTLADNQVDDFWDNILFADIDGNGKDDLILGLGGYKLPCNHCGAVYLLRDSLFSSTPGTGNTLNLANTSDFNIRYELSSGGSQNMGVSLAVGDVNGNGIPDLLIGAMEYDAPTITDSGAVFVIYDNLLSATSGLGNVVQIDNPANYSGILYGSAFAEGLGGQSIFVNDLNNDGANDLIVSASAANARCASW